MPAIEPLARADLAEYEPMFEMVEAVMGFLPNSLMTMARWPELMQAFMGVAALINSPRTVDAEMKQLVAYMASRSAGCAYCQAHTSHSLVEKGGASAAKLEAIWDYERSPLFTEAERAALTVAQGAGQVPNMVSDADREALADHFEDDQILEIIAVIALFGFLNRFNDTMGTTLEDGPRSFAESHLAADGWHVGKHG